MSTSTTQILPNISFEDAPPRLGNFPVDEAVLRGLPKGSKLVSAIRHGTSAWTASAQLEIELPDGSLKQYRLKCANDIVGRRLMEGEYHALHEMHKTMANFVPEPLAWGKYDNTQAETYFVLLQFIDMQKKMPDPKQLCSKLAQLHQTSTSPTGMFGFHVPTCNGRIHQHLDWNSSWTTFFTNLLKHAIDLDFKRNGPWKELELLESHVLSDVIPRLIGNLERDGRNVKPSLIHGNLWEGNTGTAYANGDVYIYDAAAYYAHHEMEIADWRCHYNKIHNKVYTKTYLRYHAPSEPREEWDDRNRMYCIYYNIVYSVNHLNQGTSVRQTAYDDMYYLIDKYAPFANGEGPLRLRDSERVLLPAERNHRTADQMASD